MIDLLVLFGGRSNEHDISISSCKSILTNINKSKYNIKTVYIDNDNNWFLVRDVNKLYKRKKCNIIKLCKWCDVCFPIMHGKYGEDGRLQGLLDCLGVNYVGCNLISSAVCMDKVLFKLILNGMGINNVPFIFVNKFNYNYKDTLENVDEKIGFPCMVKPANSGSSIGISKVNSFNELERSIKEAFLYDDKILIEKFIDARELEVAILDNKISHLGEINNENSFYSYQDKYVNKTTTSIASDIHEELEEEIKSIAYNVYKSIGCKDLARCDFLLERNSNKIYFNEINTMPGFTSISMYPTLINDLGIDFSSLIDKLISLNI